MSPGRPGRGGGPAPRVLLVGLMAAGKSTVGRLVAARLGCRYLDNDELVAQAAGSALAALAAERGEGALRAAESAALHRVLDHPPPLVAGVAASVVLDPADRRRLAAADALVVWLRARPETLAARVGDGGDRPWLRPDPLAAFARMAAERARWYAEVADLVVDVDETSPAAVADIVADMVVADMVVADTAAADTAERTARG